MTLITQAKEAEAHRNREMKRFAGDREHHAKQLIEAVSSQWLDLHSTKTRLKIHGLTLQNPSTPLAAFQFLPASFAKHNMTV